MQVEYMKNADILHVYNKPKSMLSIDKTVNGTGVKGNTWLTYYSGGKLVGIGITKFSEMQKKQHSTRFEIYADIAVLLNINVRKTIEMITAELAEKNKG